MNEMYYNCNAIQLLQLLRHKMYENCKMASKLLIIIFIKTILNTIDLTF